MTKKLLVTSLSILLAGNLLVSAAYAFGVDADVNVCSPSTEGFKWSQLIFGTNIQKTLQDSVIGGVNVAIGGTEGASVDEIVGCDAYLQRGCIAFPEGVCGGTADNICEELSNRGSSTDTASLDLRQRGVRGSLLGMSYTLENIAYTEPLAVNFAYFWNRNLEKLPVVGGAFAASESGYNMPLLDAAYSLWELVRNVSLGIISVVLLYTGIMIIMRKKMNSQLVVSVQYAIPKIVIGLLLIIFSYPIGAAITGISWGLFRGATSIVGNAAGLCQGQVGRGDLYLAVLIGVLKTGFGWGRVVVLLLTGLGLVIMSIIVYVKAILIYLKMVIGVITAPFEMALGTIPGSEGKIMDWFKRMAKLGLSVFAMGAAIPIVLILAYNILINYRTGPSEVGGFGSLLRVLVPPLVIIYGFGLALGMEKTIASFFGEDKKRK